MSQKIADFGLKPKVEKNTRIFKFKVGKISMIFSHHFDIDINMIIPLIYGKEKHYFVQGVVQKIYVFI